jgi:hypothetical protein
LIGAAAELSWGQNVEFGVLRSHAFFRGWRTFRGDCAAGRLAAFYVDGWPLDCGARFEPIISVFKLESAMKTFWFHCAALAVLAIASAADAGTIAYEGNTPPNTNILASQLTDSSGSLEGNNDYTDNAGPPGELFTVSQNSLLEDITVLGGNSWGPPTGMHLLVGSVNPSTGVVTPLNGNLGDGGGESVPVPANANDYVTYQLSTPIDLTAGTEYVFGLYTDNMWYGLAHSATDTAAGAVNFNDTDTFENNNTGRPAKNDGFGQYAVLNTGDYGYVFAAQGVAVVPEPASIALFGIGAIGLLLVHRGGSRCMLICGDRATRNLRRNLR